MKGGIEGMDDDGMWVVIVRTGAEVCEYHAC